MAVDVRHMQPLAEEATGLLKALAHPARLMICCQVREGEMSVAGLEQTLGLKQPRLSRELAKLRAKGVLTARREAKTVFYRLSDDRAGALMDALCAIMLGEAGGAPEPVRRSA